MLRSLSTPALMALALTLVGANALLGMPLAHAEGEEQVLNVDIPTRLPMNAVLGSQAPTQQVDGLTVALERTDEGVLAVAFTNPTDQAIPVANAARVVQTNYQPMGRMGPIPLEVAATNIELAVPAGQTRRVVFANVTVPAPQPDPSEGEPAEGEPLPIQLFMGSTTTELLLGDQLIARLDA